MDRGQTVEGLEGCSQGLGPCSEGSRELCREGFKEGSDSLICFRKFLLTVDGLGKEEAGGRTGRRLAQLSGERDGEAVWDRNGGAAAAVPGWDRTVSSQGRDIQPRASLSLLVLVLCPSSCPLPLNVSY
jgi:hypothetical protein